MAYAETTLLPKANRRAHADVMAQSDKCMMVRVCQKKLLPGNWPERYSFSPLPYALAQFFPKNDEEISNAKKGGMAEMPDDMERAKGPLPW